MSLSKDDRDLAICLVSGGMDSLVSTAIAATKHTDLAFLHVNYGQKTHEREVDCFDRIADHYGIEKKLRKIIHIDFLKHIGGSSLTDDAIHIKPHGAQPGPIVPDSYVPFRNTHIIAMAVSWAEIIGAGFIYIGAVEEDSSGYPDCRPEYYKAVNELVRQGTQKGPIEIKTPVITLSKKQIVLKALELKAPLTLTWSCYQNNKTACGVCDSCTLRLKGFKQASVEDPLPYASKLA